MEGDITFEGIREGNFTVETFGDTYFKSQWGDIVCEGTMEENITAETFCDSFLNPSLEGYCVLGNYGGKHHCGNIR